jgi:hypothetical protein
MRMLREARACTGPEEVKSSMYLHIGATKIEWQKRGRPTKQREATESDGTHHGVSHAQAAWQWDATPSVAAIRSDEMRTTNVVGNNQEKKTRRTR